MRRASARIGDRNSTREEAQRGSERSRFAVELRSMPAQVVDTQRGSSERFSRLSEGGRRARAVRFLDEAKETRGNLVGADKAVDGASQTVQSKKGEKGGPRLSATAAHGDEAAETKTSREEGYWTCVVCRAQNDELGGAEGCATCGRRRPGRPQHRGGGAGLETVPPDDRIALSSKHIDATTDRLHEKERGEIGINAERSFAHPGARTSKGSSREENADRSATGKTAAQSEHRGPYDISSFAKMRQATQPIVNARLSLTREIQSLLTSIRR